MIPFVKLIDRSTGNLVCINANYIVEMATATPQGCPPYTLIYLQTIQGGPMAIGVDMTIEQIDQLIWKAQQPC